MKIPKYFREWFNDSNVSRSNIWSWTDIDKHRLLIIAWAAYRQGVENTETKYWEESLIRKNYKLAQSLRGLRGK